MIGGFRITAAHQNGNQIERVEKEMWVNLHLQSVEPRSGQLRFKLRGALLALAEAATTIERLIQADDD